MTTIEFYSTLHGLNIRLWLVGDRLHYAAPEGVLTPSLREELKKRKPELVVFLRDVAVALGQASTSIPHTARDKSLPLSFGQERLWFLDQSRPGLSTYNNPIALRLTGQLSVSALEASVNEIVRRHEVLRTSFVVVDEQPTQVIAPKLEFKLPVIDLSGVADIERETETRRLVTQEAQRPFDLGCGPLIRARLLRVGESEHVLILDMHHIVSDGWSMGVFFQELATLYKAFSKGERSPLTEPSIQYADFSVWQREWLQGEELEKQLSYWKERMRASLPVLQLPADRSRPATATYTGSTQTFVLPDELSRTLKALSQEQGVTLYMLLLAAFKVLLMRYSGQTDIIVGSPISNRVHRELEGLIGFFVNNLVLRTDLAGDPSFVELLRRVREVCLGAYAHPDLPFEKLVQELHLERDMSYNPLFQVMFVLQNAPIGGLEIPGLSISTVEVENRTAKFDLTLTMLETGQGLAGRLEYTTDIFEPATIVRLLRHFQILLEGIAANPAQLLSELPLMDEAELHQMLIEWNDTKVQYPREKCIHVLFEEQVERTPDTVAVIFEKQKLTYREVNERANQIAHYLRKLGAGPEVPVGLFLERCADLVVAILGILKSGSPYVPLDTLYPLERRTEIMSDSGLKILVTQEALGSGEHVNDLVLLCLDRQRNLLAAEDKQNPIQVNKPENLAYIIYTSGSTGKPNGVEISHRSLVNCLLSANQRIGLSAGNLSIAVFTPTFDVSVFDFLGPLCLGATVVVASREEVYDSALLAKKIMELPVTSMSAAPSTWRMLLETGWQGKTGLKVISTGEALPSDLANRLIKINLEVYNLYGPTETTIWCASKR